ITRVGALLKPRYRILGADIAGQVFSVGRSVNQFQPGDEVLGDLSGCGWGGFAEYVCARENALALKPAGMNFEEAAAVPQAAVLALQGLRDEGKIRPGQKVLINGAGGGVGTFAVQIAKAFGAEATGVDSTGKLDMLRSIGADRVIDYTREDFAKTGQRYDLILDVAANRSISDYSRSLNPEGGAVLIGGSMSRILGIMFKAPGVLKREGKKIGLLMHKPNSMDLDFIKALFATGKVKSVIDRCYPLRETAEAFRYFGKGQVRGKVVITMEHTGKT
ncbi:MAG: NAD(P)-dependent alcohol dehydrogenase, partial [Spirochaetales bacterium]